MQLLLLPDPRPLVETIGAGFFRCLPPAPGVYVMRDHAGRALYVGKAKNLRKRLCSYRVANPERMPRRHLRMLRQVVTIDFEICESEESALAREAQLLLLWQPTFNRAGKWIAPQKYLLWKYEASTLRLRTAAAPEAGWNAAGPMGSGRLRFLHQSLLVVLWFALNPEAAWYRMPHGSAFRTEESTLVGPEAGLIGAAQELSKLFSSGPEPFRCWACGCIRRALSPFESALLAEHLDVIAESLAARKSALRFPSIDAGTPSAAKPSHAQHAAPAFC